MSFTSLALSKPLLRAIEEQGYIAPTPIQSAVIPAILQGQDVRASAQTGSGKTAAFALPILERVSRLPREMSRPVRALVLVPTRELAMQIGQAFTAYARYLREELKIVTVFGGVSINPQMMALRGGADIVVATPGRLLDLAENNAVHVNAVQTLVLDEADKLFELGFADELVRVFEIIPAERQTLLFSATFPPAVQTLAEITLRNPIRIDIEAAPANEPAITQRSIAVDAPKRTQLLRQLIQDQQWTRVLVFVATKYSTEHVAEKLRRAGINAAPLHGELSQSARTQALADFKASKVQALIATDVAARGIDITHLPVVVNYDLPRSAVDYTHRIGRTGRAGHTGVAVSFITPESEDHFRLIEKRNGFRLERETIAGFESTAPAIEAEATEESQDTQSPPKNTGGVKGKRKSKKDKLREAATNVQAPSMQVATPANQAEPIPTKQKFVWPTRKP
jgi:ATP-dependent RNA helicase RhlE